jgi:hypothetical protein
VRPSNMTSMNLVKNVFSGSGNNSYSSNSLDADYLNKSSYFDNSANFEILDNGYVLEYEVLRGRALNKIDTFGETTSPPYPAGQFLNQPTDTW